MVARILDGGQDSGWSTKGGDPLWHRGGVPREGEEGMAVSASTRPRLVAGLRLVRLVGSGGEGEVWEARDQAGRSRALKLIRPAMLADPDAVERRGTLLRRIDHPALVRVYRTGLLTGSSLEGWGFVEMEFVTGGPLERAPADPHTLERLEPLAEALDLLHDGEWSDGVPLVHRDVKPANLIVRPDGEVVLVDCSTLRDADVTHMTRIGTPVFAAPEAFTGRSGPAADVYSFAVTVVALVTGARGAELVELLAEPWRLELPPAVAWALSPDPHERPRSCTEVLESGATIQFAPVDAWSIDSDEPSGLVTDLPALHGGRSGVRGTAAWWLLPLGATLAAVAAPTLRLAATDPLFLWGIAAVTHLGAQKFAGRRLLPAVLLPPVAWALLLSARSSAPRRGRAWLRTAAAGALTAATVGAALAILDNAGTPEFAAAALASGWITTALSVAAVADDSGLGLALRWVLGPCWLMGALLLILGSIIALPVVAVMGQAAATLRLLARTVGSAAGFVRRDLNTYNWEAP